MDFEQIFETAKQEMMEDLEGLTLSNFLEKKELIYAHIHFMESIQELRESKMRCSQNNLDMHDESAVPSDINPPNAEQTREASLESQEGERKMYLFKRSVLGGYLPELNAIVPEGIVRKLGLENHDYVYATEVPNSNPEKKKYVYELAKKAEHPIPCDRVQYNYCPIEMDGSIMVVRRSLEIDDEIRIGEIPYSVRIQKNAECCLSIQLKNWNPKSCIQQKTQRRKAKNAKQRNGKSHKHLKVKPYWSLAMNLIKLIIGIILNHGAAYFFGQMLKTALLPWKLMCEKQIL